jgi:outer membrane lipoprotein-sorting protein
VTARIRFTNHLIDSGNLEGSDPILTGATGRLWLSHRQLRLELQSDQGDAQVVADGKRFWIYDARSNAVYRGSIPTELTTEKGNGESKGAPSLEQVREAISRLMRNAALSDAVPGDIAGQPTYSVRISPKRDGGLLGAGEVAWDAIQRVPLRLAVFAQGDSSPVLELGVSDVSYGAVPASVFDISPPHDAKVVDLSPSRELQPGGADHPDAGPATGPDAVARAVPFKLSSPDVLAGLPRHELRSIDWGDKPAALVTYGQDLRGLAVIEKSAEPAGSTGDQQSKGGSESGGDHGALSLPTVSVNGATGEELRTALGTMVRFDRKGVSYTVIGSVPPATVEAAARGL